ncbi:MAG TPA: DUF6569 family protein [Planctomycetota bacterium]|nr:DUF6569 family protein [Planctomycetota bacterium]
MRLFLAAGLLAIMACSKTDPIPPQTTAPANAEAQVPAGSVAAKDGEAPPPAGLEAYRISGPRGRGNLAVYLFHLKGAPTGDFDGLTLEEGLKSGAVKVTEKVEGAEVNELLVENTGDKPVYLQAGDTVKGGQQDRTIGVDFVLPPKSGKRTVEAFCVEPGRWSVREGGLTTASAGGRGAMGGAVFALSENAPALATNAQKLAVRLDKSQEKVWAAGKAVNADLAAKTGGGGGTAWVKLDADASFVLTAENPAVTKKVDESVAALLKMPDGQADVVGAAFCINGKIQNVELYSTGGLFRKLWPKLLRSAATEALAKTPEGEPAKAPTEAELRATLADLAGQKGREELRKDGPTVRIFERDKAVLFDTECEGKVLHRQVLTK